MLFPSESVTLGGLIILLSLPATIFASPVVPVDLHCGDFPLNNNDVTNAFNDLAGQTGNDLRQMWLPGKSSAFGHAGNVQFYICNNAYSKRYFTMDQPALDEVINSYQYCGSKAFWKMHSDKWSLGVDIDGRAECGGF